MNRFIPYFVIVFLIASAIVIAMVYYDARSENGIDDEDIETVQKHPDSDFQAKVDKAEMQTSAEGLSDLFPTLVDARKCYWKTGINGEDNSEAQGSNDFWYIGYIYPDQSDIDYYLENFTWNHIESDIKPRFLLPDSNEITHHWIYSKAFSDYIKSQYYLGKVYLDTENKLLYFDISTS